MKVKYNVSLQEISWVKSNQKAFEQESCLIPNVYYPDTLEEFYNLIVKFNRNGEEYLLIGYSSNTLFLPSYKIDNVIVTRMLNHWTETEDEIICECGVNVSQLAHRMVERGNAGFEGLTDLPGTVAAAVYGNCGCRNCSVNALLNSIDIISKENRISTLTREELDCSYRSTALKRGEINGVILSVRLQKVIGDSEELKIIAEKNHQIRREQQPSGVNNLGTTFVGGSLTIKGKLFYAVERMMMVITKSRDRRKTFPMTLKLMGQGKFAPYVYYWNRYMFLDEKSHLLFFSYYKFLQSLYKDIQLEIEIRS